jgi:hypothetical protein
MSSSQADSKRSEEVKEETANGSEGVELLQIPGGQGKDKTSSPDASPDDENASSMVPFKPEPILTPCEFWVQTIYLSVAALLAQMVFVVLFSAVGRGDEVFIYLSERSDWAFPAAMAGFVLFLLLYIFDFNYWEGCWRGVYFVGVGATVILMVLAGILSARDYPALPMAIFMCGIPLYFWIIQKLVLSPPSLSNKELREDLAEEQAAEDAVAMAEQRASRMVASVELRQEKAYDQYVATFVLSLGYALVATGLICGGIWVGWVVTGNPWNTEIEEEYELR